jgi:pimeloyl-ACP methyl ester carboxylesterase
VTPDSCFIEAGRGVGALVLSGSSGRVEADRCQVLAEVGVTALSVRWSGGPGQPAAVDRVPLEFFEEPLARLHERCERLVVLGTSRGAEAALLLGALHPEVDAVVGFSPSHVVWAALTPARPQRSSWTRGGEPLPFVPYDDEWSTDLDPPELVGLHEHSLERYADRVPAARIPVEKIGGEVLLTAGHDDRLWPSLDLADEVVAARAAAGRVTTLVDHPAAGHRVVLPGEPTLRPRPGLAHGGTPAADRELGTRVWPELLRVLGLG